jgi:hypothetical protein
MPIALVQTTNNSGETSSVSSLAVTLTLTAGNLVIISCVNSPAVTASIADTNGNTFTLVPTPAFPVVSVSGAYSAWYIENCKGGATTVTVTFSAGSAYSSIVVSEFSGAALSGVFDTGSFDYYSSTTAYTDFSSGNFTTAENNELIYAFSNIYHSGGTSAAAGYVQLFQDTSTGAGAAFTIHGAAGVSSGEMDTASSNQALDVFGLAFKPAVSGPPIADFAPHTLTSDTSDPPYVVSSSGVDGGYYDWQAFNGNTAVPWQAPAPSWIQLDTGAGNAYVLNLYTIYAGSLSTGDSPAAWTMEGSPDGTTWTTLDTQTGQTWTANSSHTYQVIGAAAFRYFKLNITANNGDPHTEVAELYLYGTAYAAPTPTQRGCIAFDQIKASDRTGNGNQLLTWSTTAPAHSTSTGAAGQIAYDSAGNYCWCYAANSWARIGPGGYSTSW